MNKYMQQDLTVRDHIATEILKGLVSNPNLIDTTNVIRASQDAESTVQRDEANHDQRLVNFARVLAERMILELEGIPG